MSQASLFGRWVASPERGKYSRQVEPRPRCLKRLAALLEQVDGVLHARARRIKVTFGLRHEALDRKRRRAQRVTANLRYDALHLVTRVPRSFRLAQCDERASVQVESSGALEPTLRAELPQESRRTVRRKGRVPDIECDLREPELGVGVELDLAEQLGRFLEPPLAPPKVSAAYQSLKRHAGPTGPKLPKRCLECGIGLLPGAAQDENRPVVRPADGEEIQDPPALSELKHSLRPLIRTLEIPHTLAGGDHVTAGAPGCPQLRHLAGHGRRRGLVQQADPVSDVSLTCKRETLQPKGRELDVGYSQRGPDRPRLLGETSRGRDVVLKEEGEFAFAEGEPAVFRHGVESFEQAVSPLQPAARDSRFAAKGDRVPAEPDGHPRGGGRVAAFTVEAICVFAGLDRELRVIEPPGRHGEGLDRLGAVVSFGCGLEVGQRLLPLPPAQRFASRRQRIHDVKLRLSPHGTRARVVAPRTVPVRRRLRGGQGAAGSITG